MRAGILWPFMVAAMARWSPSSITSCPEISAKITGVFISSRSSHFWSDCICFSPASAYCSWGAFPNNSRVTKLPSASIRVRSSAVNISRRACVRSFCQNSSLLIFLSYFPAKNFSHTFRASSILLANGGSSLIILSSSSLVSRFASDIHCVLSIPFARYKCLFRGGRGGKTRTFHNFRHYILLRPAKTLTGKLTHLIRKQHIAFARRHNLDIKWPFNLTAHQNADIRMEIIHIHKILLVKYRSKLLHQKLGVFGTDAKRRKRPNVTKY